MGAAWELIVSSTSGRSWNRRDGGGARSAVHPVTTPPVIPDNELSLTTPPPTSGQESPVDTSLSVERLSSTDAVHRTAIPTTSDLLPRTWPSARRTDVTGRRRRITADMTYADSRLDRLGLMCLTTRSRYICIILPTRIFIKFTSNFLTGFNTNSRIRL